MLIARDLTLRRGAEPLFEQVNFTIFRGEKVGLTGANGSGKSSLFAAVCGELGPDRGEPRKAPQRRDALAQLRRELEQIERRIAGIAAERSLLDAELLDCAEQGKLADKNARLIRDAAKWEARWVEVGTAIEEAEARSSYGG
jgi:ATPase subunit of ABC transporter with duplicated ATPase domains